MTFKPACAFLAAAALALVACRGSVLPAPPTKASRFESPAWGAKLAYPADWTARPGKDMDPAVLELRAPGSTETAGTSVTLVGFHSAASLDEMVSAYARRLPARTFSSRLTCGGYPAAAFDYATRVDGKLVRTRSVLTRAPGRFFVLTLAAYEPQHEFARTYFSSIETSLEIAGE
jgi:hypothetical protein